MKASIEIDVLVHLGKFVNIDLLQRGVYLIEITLLYGLEKRRITPVSLFSSPSHLNSHVGETLIEGGSMLTPCEVDEANHIFRSRSILIRYKGEKHELNEGVQWRINLPSFELGSDAPLCPDLLFVQFGLVYQEYEETPPDEDGKTSFQITGPREIVSLQLIGLQSVGSGFHQFFPINFDGHYCVNMETMIHACVSNITYHSSVQTISDLLISNNASTEGKLAASSSPRRASAVTMVSSPTNNTTPLKRISTVIEQPVFDPNGSIFDGNFINFSAMFNKISRKSTTAATPSGKKLEDSSSHRSAVSTVVTETSNDSVTAQLPAFQSLSEQQWKLMIVTLFLPIFKNQEIALQESQFIVDLYEQWKDSIDLSPSHHSHSSSPHSTSATTTNPLSPPTYSPRAQLIAKQETLSQIPTQLLRIYESVMKLSDWSEVFDYFEQEIDRINHQLTLHWSLLFNSCRKVMTFIKRLLRPVYLHEAAAFWKQQMMIHTRSFQGSERLSNRKDVITLQTLEEHIEMERQNDLEIQRAIIANKAKSTAAVISSKYFTQQLMLTSPNTSIYHNGGTKGGGGEEAVVTSRPRRKSIFSNLIHQNLELFFREETKNDARGKKALEDEDEEAGLFEEEEEVVVEERDHHRQDRKTQVVITKRSKSKLRYEDLNLTVAMTPRMLARGMKVFDVNSQMYPSKTAYLFLEKYINEQTKIDRTLNSLESKLQDDLGESDHHQNNSLAVSTARRPSTTTSTSTTPQLFQGKHLVILQHGFLGTGYDMRLFLQAIKILCPGNVYVYTATANEHSSQETIAMMGKNLRNELLKLFTEKYPEYLEMDFTREELRISFIAHSMGGLMVRSALQEKELRCLHNKLDVFLSLSVPHLGNTVPDSTLVSTAMWALSKWKNCVSLRELMLEDGSLPNHHNNNSSSNSRGATPPRDKEQELLMKYQQSFLYKLSEESCWSRFRKIVLVASPKDQYVSFYSARLQITPKTEEQSLQGKIIHQMIDNLLQSLAPEQLLRLTLVNNINYNIYGMQQAIQEYATLNNLQLGDAKPPSINIPGSSGSSGSGGSGSGMDLNNMIGRTAHICYLENPAIAFQLIQTLLPYFLYEDYPY